METEDGPDSKRQRLTPSQSQEPSQFTESSKAPSQRLDTDLKALENHLLQLKTVHADEINQLRMTLSNVQTRLEERDKMLESLQHRYETRTKAFHQVRKERDSHADKLAKAEQRVEKQQEEIAKLKDERTQLKQDLEAARKDLKTEGGNVAELEAAREEIRRLTKENASLERKSEYERKQAEYTREQYQNASTAAAQSGMEIRQLKDENQELKRKIAAEAVKLKEMKLKSDETRHLQRAIELEMTLVSREELLRRKEDELREFRKNRPATRSTSSQPRSPKWGPGNSRPTSPGINNNGNSSNGLAGRGSSALRFSSEMSPL
jgi:chromosome segregation ATPase